MYLSDGQLLRLSDEGLEATYGWARYKQKTAWHARAFGLARSWEAIAGQCTSELLKRELARMKAAPAPASLF